MQGGVAELPSKPKRYVPLRDPRRLNRDADMRSPDGQRFAAIFDTLVLEFGDAGPDRIRDIAVLRFAAEKALDVGNFEDVVRLHNTIERKESRLRAMLRVKRLERGSQSPEGPSVPACGSIRRQGPCAMKATRTASAAFGPGHSVRLDLCRPWASVWPPDAFRDRTSIGGCCNEGAPAATSTSSLIAEAGGDEATF
jgi:hypothetical protein